MAITHGMDYISYRGKLRYVGYVNYGDFTSVTPEKLMEAGNQEAWQNSRKGIITETGAFFSRLSKIK